MSAETSKQPFSPREDKGFVCRGEQNVNVKKKKREEGVKGERYPRAFRRGAT